LFGLKRTTKEQLATHDRATTYCVFGCGSEALTAIIPYGVISDILDLCHTSPDKQGGILHWHLRFKKLNGRLSILFSHDNDALDVEQYVLKR
jgi:hypothetical protein